MKWKPRPKRRRLCHPLLLQAPEGARERRYWNPLTLHATFSMIWRRSFRCCFLMTAPSAAHPTEKLPCQSISGPYNKLQWSCRLYLFLSAIALISHKPLLSNSTISMNRTSPELSEIDNTPTSSCMASARAFRILETGQNLPPYSSSPHTLLAEP